MRTDESSGNSRYRAAAIEEMRAKQEMEVLATALPDAFTSTTNPKSEDSSAAIAGAFNPAASWAEKQKKAEDQWEEGRSRWQAIKSYFGSSNG